MLFEGENTVILPDNWGELLLPGLRTIFSKHLKGRRNYIRELFNVETSNKAQEFSLGTGSLGEMDPWDGQVSYEDFNRGFKATYTHRKWSKGLVINREMLDDDLYNEIRKHTRNLADSVSYTRQRHGVSVFNNGFSDAFPGPDGKALFSTAHPYSPSNAATWANLTNRALDSNALEYIRTQMMTNWKDDKGKDIIIDPDELVLLVPTILRKPALVIAGSPKEPDVSDNNINVWKGEIQVMEWPMLSSGGGTVETAPWFVLERRRLKKFLNWFDRRKPGFDSEVNFDTEAAKYKTVGRWSYGWDDPTIGYASNPQ